MHIEIIYELFCQKYYIFILKFWRERESFINPSACTKLCSGLVLIEILLSTFINDHSREYKLL
jgi:hypothetical protein